jgi:hypothetical protein
MAPVDESKDKPTGSVGETDHEVTGPPLAVGVTVVIAVPLVNVSELEGMLLRKAQHRSQRS